MSLLIEHITNNPHIEEKCPPSAIYFIQDVPYNELYEIVAYRQTSMKSDQMRLMVS